MKQLITSFMQPHVTAALAQTHQQPTSSHNTPKQQGMPYRESNKITWFITLLSSQTSCAPNHNTTIAVSALGLDSQPYIQRNTFANSFATACPLQHLCKYLRLRMRKRNQRHQGRFHPLGTTFCALIGGVGRSDSN